MNIELYHPIAIHELGGRDNQEDTIYPSAGNASAEDRLYMVCDGMGGHEKGEVASRVVAESISSYVTQNKDKQENADRLVKQAISAALNALNETDKDSKEPRKMGTTIAIVYFHHDGCLMAHIGDSRIYHIRPSERRILYKSRDHSLVYDLFLAEEITFDEMRTHPKKNVITRAIMPGLEENPLPGIAQTTDVRKGDLFYLCSDGMLEHMSDGDLLEILCSADNNEVKRSNLIAATEYNADNHSAYLVEVGNVTKEECDDAYPNDELSVRCNAMLYENPNALKTETHNPFPKSDASSSILKKALLPILLTALLVFIIIFVFKLLTQ